MFSNLYSRDNSTWRIYILTVFVLIFFSIILFRLFQIQVVKHDLYKALAQDQHEFFEKTIPKRGEIFTRSKYSGRLYPLAVNSELNLVYVVPRNIENKKEVSQQLSEILEMDEEAVFNIVNKENDPYEVVKHRVDDDLARKIEEQNISGVGVVSETFRYYPGDYLAANVIGFLGYDGNKRVGQYGIEGYYNDRMEGEMGFLELEKDATGSWISIGLKSVHPSEDGDDVILTIDRTIQYVAEKKLKEAIEKYGAESGNIIIINPKSGEVVALAQYPSYNPNEYFKEKDMSVFLNSGIHNVYEPGSIQKPITMAIGIDLRKINPSTTYVDEGLVKVDGWTIRNSDGQANGKQNMIQVL
jgi:cell division protein FtsI/penicillin-binding protein 2